MDTDEILDVLGEIEDPGLGEDVVSLGLVNDVTVDGDTVRVSLALGAPYSPAESSLADEVRERLSAEGLDVELTAAIDDGTGGEETVLSGVENVIAVASGKGGVGKSTVAINLAAGLAEMGASVGLFDADVYGPNVPRMLDAEEPPQATPDETLVPPEQFGVQLMSMAFLVGEDDPVIWRGPMVHKVLTQLWEDVEWGQLDYMVIDLPPGTGDTQLTMLQSVPVTGAVIVTTPQEVALDDARKGLEMFARHETNVLGIVENMAAFRCPDCGSEHAIFGSDGGRQFADVHDMPFLGSVPLDPAVREGGDDGRPVVLDGNSETGARFREITDAVADNVGIVRRRSHSERTTSPEIEH